mgnify:CR=1 FL=1
MIALERAVEKIQNVLANIDRDLRREEEEVIRQVREDKEPHMWIVNVKQIVEHNTRAQIWREALRLLQEEETG